MDPIRLSASPRVMTPPVPTGGKPQGGAALPTDTVERQTTGRPSGLLDKAKLASLVGAGTIVTSGLLFHAGAVGLAATLGATAGLVCVAAAGLAVAHAGKRLFAGAPAAQSQPKNRLLDLAAGSSAVAGAGILATNLAAYGGLYGAIGALSAVTGGAALLGVGLAAVHFGRKLFASSAGTPAPPQATGKPDIAAPGPNSLPGGTLNLAGTGFAAPLAAGRAAAYLAANPGASPAEVREALTSGKA